MLEMVQTESAASSVTDHRGNIAVAGGGESASVISQHNNRRWRLFQVSIGERMEGRRLLGVMPLNSVQLHAIPLGILTPGTTNDFISIWDFLFPSGQSIWLMLSINILLKCDKANESFNCCGTGWESLAYIYFQQSKCDDWFFCFTHTHRWNVWCARLALTKMVFNLTLRAWTVKWGMFGRNCTSFGDLDPILWPLLAYE